MNNETIFKGNITRIDRDFNVTNNEIIYFRVINFGNVYFFAEEISTGCIFPVYSFTEGNESNRNKIKFKTCSYLKSGKYFVFYPLTKGNIFEYSSDEKSFKVGDIELANIDELNAYLTKKKDNKKWEKLMQSLESENEFVCDIQIIKDKIAMVKDENKPFVFDVKKNNPRYDNYVSALNLKEISDLGYDLSKQVELCNLVGREKEKKKVIKATGIGGDSVILVGEAGSGKTAIVESLALDIKNRQCEWLKDKTIFYLDTGSLVAGTKYRGEFEDKIKKFIQFCQKNRGRIIVFIDEIHTLYKLGASDGNPLDAMNILKPYITKGDITIIGATTKAEYEEYIASDPAFSRRCEKVNVGALDLSMNIQIILAYINDLENKYKIKLDLDDEQRYYITKYIIEITDPKNQRVVGDIKENNPSISKKIIKDAFIEALYNKSEVVSVNDICYAIEECDKFTPSFKEARAYELLANNVKVNREDKAIRLIRMR